MQSPCRRVSGPSCQAGDKTGALIVMMCKQLAGVLGWRKRPETMDGQ